MRVIVLAAGLSERMGQQKMLLPLGGRPLIEQLLDALAGGGLTRPICVVSEAVAGHFSPPPNATIVLNPEPERGKSSSFRLGLEALVAGELKGRGSGDDERAPFAVTVGDLPYLRASDVEALRAQFERRLPGKTAMIPMRGRQPGHPQFFERQWADRLLSGYDAGNSGRETIASCGQEIASCPAPPGSFADMDTPGDYRRACACR